MRSFEFLPQVVTQAILVLELDLPVQSRRLTPLASRGRHLGNPALEPVAVPTEEEHVPRREVCRARRSLTVQSSPHTPGSAYLVRGIPSNHSCSAENCCSISRLSCCLDAYFITTPLRSPARFGRPQDKDPTGGGSLSHKKFSGSRQVPKAPVAKPWSERKREPSCYGLARRTLCRYLIASGACPLVPGSFHLIGLTTRAATLQKDRRQHHKEDDAHQGPRIHST